MTDLFGMRLKELRRRDWLFTLAKIKRNCPFPKSNGNELNYLLCFRASSEENSKGSQCFSVILVEINTNVTVHSPNGGKR